MVAHRAFPLDAEQIVRGVGHVLAIWLNRTLAPDAPRIDPDGVTMVLAEKMGVPLPIRRGENPWDRQLAPHGSSIQPESAAGAEVYGEGWVNRAPQRRESAPAPFDLHDDGA